MIGRFIAFLVVVFAANAQMSISGKVVDPLGNGVPMVYVTIQSEEAPDTVYTARTNNSGEFEAKGIPPGSYQVRITSPGFRSVSLAARVSSEHPREDLKSIVLQVAPMGDVYGDSFEVLPETAGWSLPRGCLFQLNTQQVNCQLEIGHIEPVEPLEPVGPLLLFKSSGDKASLIPRNGAQIALDQPCRNAVYSDRPAVVDRPGLTTTVCLRSPARNFRGMVSPTLLVLSP